MGGDNSDESNLGERLLLGVEGDFRCGWPEDWPSSASLDSSGSISDSSVTIIGRLTGRDSLRPKMKPCFMAGYRGIGETRTVKSVMVVKTNVMGGRGR
jgi:hypothetical protein